MSTVVSFRPDNGQKLENIPHMLRYWADALERGEEPMPKTALLVMNDGVSPPEFCVFGDGPSPLELIGLFAVLQQRVGITTEGA